MLTVTVGHVICPDVTNAEQVSVCTPGTVDGTVYNDPESNTVDSPAAAETLSLQL